MSAVILQDEIVHYEVLGRGRPIIFLHSWVGSWRYWIPTMQAASFNYRAYALDLWGFGDTAKNTANYSLEQQVNLLDEFLQTLGIGKVALIGHGLGAIVALLFGQRFGRFVDRIMVIGLPEGRSSVHPRLYTESPVELADWLLGRDESGEAARIESPKADPRAIQLSMYDLNNLDLAQLSRDQTIPCLIVSGQDDPVVSGPSIEQVNAYPEHVHLIQFEQSGHFPMLDSSTRFQRLMTDFLALGPGIGPRQLQLKEEWKRRVR
jgi:pimeloyl-ACP methyl ester carboxylesterase